MRHFKVDFKWKNKYSSIEFKIACDKYDNANIINQISGFDSSNIKQTYLSELSRSTLTYKALNINLKPCKTNLVNEVPIAPFINTKLKLPTALWMIMGRIQWFLNIQKQPETRHFTLNKIERLINRLEAENNDVLIIGHGFHFSQLKRILKKRKYYGNGKSRYKNGEFIKFKKVFS